MLDDSKHHFEVHKHAKGSVLVDMVFEYLGCPPVERDYFGLQFAERTEDADGMRWLDPSKAIKKQFKLNPPYLFYFRVKFYVADPCALQEETTRYHFFLQIQKDILEGRLVVPQPTAILLASYAVQCEYHTRNRVARESCTRTRIAFVLFQLVHHLLYLMRDTVSPCGKAVKVPSHISLKYSNLESTRIHESTDTFNGPPPPPAGF